MSKEPTPQQVLYKAVHKLLRPLVRILLRNGIAFNAFADIAKQVYVEVADKDFAVQGKKQTNSRISTITGLTRKEVQRLKDLTPDQSEADIDYHNRAARVVYGWVHDNRFSDTTGSPANLPFDGDGPSFSQLVRAHSGDMPPRAVLDELIRVGVVAKLDDNHYSLLARAYIPSAGTLEKLHILGTDVYGLLETLDRNIHFTDKEPYFQRKVFYDNLPVEAIAGIRALISEDGQALLEKANQHMAQLDRDMNPESQGSGRRAAGIGIYYFEDEDFKEH